jgi:hypothetical protein
MLMPVSFFLYVHLFSLFFISLFKNTRLVFFYVEKTLQLKMLKATTIVTLFRSVKIFVYHSFP